MSDPTREALELLIETETAAWVHDYGPISYQPHAVAGFAKHLADKLIAGRESRRSGRRTYDRLRETLATWWPRKQR